MIGELRSTPCRFRGRLQRSTGGFHVVRLDVASLADEEVGVPRAPLASAPATSGGGQPGAEQLPDHEAEHHPR